MKKYGPGVGTTLIPAVAIITTIAICIKSEKTKERNRNDPNFLEPI